MNVPKRSHLANVYHSITIGDDAHGYKNTWDDWHLVPASRPLIAPPPIKSSYLDLVGGDGFIDMTESLTGKTTYGNRSGSWEFIVINQGQIQNNFDGIINLFNKNKVNSIRNLYIEANSGRAIISSDIGYRTIILDCKPNTVYTASCGTNTTLRIASYLNRPKNNMEASSSNAPSAKTLLYDGLTLTTGPYDRYLAVQVVDDSDIRDGTSYQDVISTLAVFASTEIRDLNKNYKQWSVLYSDIMRFLHGKRYNIILNDDPDWYYTGRLTVSAWNPGQHNSTITINYNVDPYKRSVMNSNTKKF